MARKRSPASPDCYALGIENAGRCSCIAHGLLLAC
jgi:hypothetical protein